ncbi:enoyl-CoA hydratase-related protein [Aeromicrobium sp.]|uniref:enoyl-CoA hydratase/isomerase family protein n=1 Tax=Aeromicrobium sp. TaxID=1871063 RepID=UPI0019A90A9B|nr:enoyl-CoA hydratase-related protein [Aeromicrobium sp.]MBC7632206.1 enoyl-CoA hydratase/isomerase family protein [Aeromicrobium sp.]
MPLPELEHLLIGRPADGVLQITLNRPDKLNALTFDMFDELTAACRALEGDQDVRVVVLTGAGKGFCAGLDLEAVAALLEMTPYQFLRGQEKWAGAALALQRLTTPVIAAVNGAAAGAGFSLALAADVRLVSTRAKFNAAFIRVGLTGGDMGSSWLLPRVVGLGIANELLLTGRFVLPDEALRIGLVNRVCEPDELLPAALEVAAAIMANSPFGIRLTKQVIQANLGAATLELGIELENRNQALTAGTADMREALTAFLEGRPATFSGD